MLDENFKKNISLYKGIVLDIGGRYRSKIEKPVKNVERWIFADIEEEHEPDIILDVANMKSISNNSIDVINASELFEHVSNPEKGISECNRILKHGGMIIISTPFMYGLHADPFDYQRWTKEKWKLVLGKNNFDVLQIQDMGYFFTVIADMLKIYFKKSNTILRCLSYFTYPIFDIIVKLDKLSTENIAWKSYVGGYYIVARKK